MIGLSRALIVAASLAGASLTSTPALANRHGIAASGTEADCQAVDENGLQLRSGLWRNLHHLLYAQATASRPSAAGRIPVMAEDAGASFLPEERAVWNRALEIYAPLAQRDLLFDAELVRIGRVLSRTGEDSVSADLPPDLRQALTSARPVYERLFWDRHRRLNGNWCGALQSRLATYGGAALDRLREIYGTEAPDFAAVEVTVYANWAGAYTSLEPVEIVIGSGHPPNAGDAALEIVIHEISHTMAVDLRRRLDEAVERLAGGPGSTAVPRDLWHQVLFYIAGEVVADLIPGYVAYADRNGLWSRVWPGVARALLEKHLRPVLDGDRPLDAALEQLVSDHGRVGTADGAG